MKNKSDDGFESVAILAKRAQYKVTQRPVAYSVTGGIHNTAGKNIQIRWRIEIAEEMGWRLGDCVDVRIKRDRTPDEPCLVKVVKCAEKGYKLHASSKRNGVSSLRVGIRWEPSLNFPNVFTQVGCDIVEVIEGGMIFRIRTEDDERPLGDMSYKEPTRIEGDSFGFTPRTLTHRFSDQKSITDIRREMEIDDKIKKGEKAEGQLDQVRKILQRRPLRRKAKLEGES